MKFLTRRRKDGFGLQTLRKGGVSAVRRIIVKETEILGKKTVYYILDETDALLGCYGVEISRSGEHCRARGLAFSGERVWRLAETLARCTVTPTGLSDVVEDWLLS